MKIDLPTPDLILPNGARLWTNETLPQGSVEWLHARSGVPTASELDTLLVTPKEPKKAPFGLGAGAITYAHTVAAEVWAGGPVNQSFENEHTRRGHAMEAEFRSNYEFMNDIAVEEVGFVLAGGLGYSPDGFVGEDGLYEGKAPGAAKQIAFLRDPGLPKEYRAQCLGGLLATGREWIDLNTGFQDFPLCTRRLRREDVESELEALADAVVRFNAYVQDTLEFVRRIAGSQADGAYLIQALPIAAE